MKKNNHLRQGCYLLSLVVALLTSACSNSNDVTHPVIQDPVAADTTVDLSGAVTTYDGYALEWSDEFENASIDPQNWTFETGTGVNGDFGTGQLDYATDRSENARIKLTSSGAGGCLAITTRKENFNDRSFTSARLSTSGKGAWGPGSRIEARIWPQDVRYKGQGFAFWMMPAEKPDDQPTLSWPQGGEIDIMEFVGSVPYHNLGSVHYAWSWENNQYQSWNHGHKGAYYNYKQMQVPSTNPGYGQWPVTSGDGEAGSGGFHIYRIDWLDDRLEFAIDGHVYHIHYFNDGAAFDKGVADGQDADANVVIAGVRQMKSEYSSHFPQWNPFAHKFFILLTAGVGGNDNLTYGGAIVPEAKFPATTLIDWVRVYKRL